MKIAVPITKTLEFCAHYGASSALACFEVDDTNRTLSIASVLQPTDGTPCAWPERLGLEGVNVMLVGGMGEGARVRCESLGIRVVTGVPELSPTDLVEAFLAGTLVPGKNDCSHDNHAHHHHHHHKHGGHCHCGH